MKKLTGKKKTATNGPQKGENFMEIKAKKMDSRHLKKIKDIMAGKSKGAFSVWDYYNTKDDDEGNYDCAEYFLGNFKRMSNIEVYQVRDCGIDFFFEHDRQHFFLSNEKESDGSVSKIVFEIHSSEYITLDTIEAIEHPRRKKPKSDSKGSGNKVINFKDEIEEVT